MEAEINVKSDNNIIRLKKDKETIKLGIRDAEGNDTGEYLEFNLGDLDYLLILQDVQEADKRNRLYLQNQYKIIDRKQDHKGKKLFSANQEAKIKATNEFLKKEVEVYDMFLGEGGVRKLLNGRKLTLGVLDEIDEIITDVILPKLKIQAKDIKESIMKKYSNQAKRDDVIE